MITLSISCSHCGKLLPEDIEVDGRKELDNIGKIIESLGWVVQYNGDYIDTYCSKRCAK